MTTMVTALRRNGVTIKGSKKDTAGFADDKLTVNETISFITEMAIMAVENLIRLTVLSVNENNVVNQTYIYVADTTVAELGHKLSDLAMVAPDAHAYVFTHNSMFYIDIPCMKALADKSDLLGDTNDLACWTDMQVKNDPTNISYELYQNTSAALECTDLFVAA